MKKALSSSKLFMKRNAPTILTYVGGAGVITTAVMAAKATPKAMQILEQAEAEKGEKLTGFEKVKAAGPVYIPTALMGAGTLACVFGANVLNKHNQASLASAYALLDNSYKEYKKKVEELYGVGANEEIRNDIAADKYEEADIQRVEGFELFFDEFSGRFFRSTLAEVQRAEYEINRDLTLQDWATINDFYDYLKIPHVDGGDIIGWSTPMNGEMYWQPWVDFSNVKMVDDDGLEYYIVRMFQEPMPDFEDYIS